MKGSKQNKKTLYTMFFKRFFDVILSLIALIILSPFLLIFYIIGLIVLKGNPVFAQYRPGKNGKVFKLYKFRSMTNKKDKNGNLLPDDQRITKWGKFIRKTSIDELPQLWNILIGNMSIVGPRPRLIKDMIFYNKETLKAYSVRPGLTGLAQVSGGRSSATWEDIFELDKTYSENITFWGDVKIIFKTVGALFKSDSGSAGESNREYYYSDYLLKNNKITHEQYNRGLDLAKKIASEKNPIVEYHQELQTKGDE